MSGWRLLAALGAIALLVALAGSAEAQVTPPARFWGVLKIDGQDPAEATKVVALVGGKECGRGGIAGREQTIKGVLYVVNVISAGQEPGCGKVGDAVSFTVDGRAANEAGKWNNEGGFLRLDLTVGAAPLGGTPAAAAQAEQRQAAAEAAESGGGLPWWIVGVVAGGAVVALGGAVAFWRGRAGAGGSPAG